MDRKDGLFTRNLSTIHSGLDSWVFSLVTPDFRVVRYEYLKTLSWRILLSVFKSSRETEMESQEAAKIASLQEGLIRRPFSFMPIGVIARPWQSPRSKANHMLLFIPSLAVKALASLLTAVILNTYVFERANRARSNIP